MSKTVGGCWLKNKSSNRAQALERANEELTRANRDLTEFAYVISHDLNAPLRALRYHCETISEHLSTRPDDPTTKGLLNAITFQSNRMSQMMNDLLAYSRIGRQAERARRVDTHALITTIVKSMPCPPGIDISLSGDWPTVHTMAAAMDVVTRNIIDNAIKHHDSDRGYIKIKAHLDDNQLNISIEDDGPGIEPKYHDAIFQPFCKLAIDDDHINVSRLPASGIGLALVRRAAESAGGEVKIISNPTEKKGSLFQINWPVFDDHNPPE